MLGDASVCNQGNHRRHQYAFAQSDVHTNYFKYVLNIFANVVGSVTFGIPDGTSVNNEQLLKHSMQFYVPEQIRTDWYPDGYVLLLI
jgi:hypothetical protein